MQSSTERLPAKAAVKAELARRSLAEFCRQAWPVLNPGRALQWAWYLDAICLHLEAVSRRECLRLLISQPPNTLKSTLVSVCWPAWEWAHRPETRFLFASNDGPLATRDAIAMRELILSDWYWQAFRPKWRLRLDQDQKTWFSNTLGGHRISYSVSSKVTGKKGDILVVDDANDARKVHSAADRQAVIDWHDLAFSGRMADEKTSPEVVVGQRTHKQDLIGHLKSKGGWEELRLPEEFDPADRCVTPYYNDPRIEAGEWLRPERFGPTEKADRLKSLGSRGYSAQHKQKPMDAEGYIFKREWFKPANNPQRIAARVRYWDKAGTQDGGCFTAGVLVSKDASGRFVIEDVVRGQWSAGARNDVMLQTAQSDRHRGRVVQVVEQEPGSGGKESAEATVRLLAGHEVRCDKVTGSKEERAQPLAAQAEAGNVYYVDAPWNAAFLDELAAFPDGQFADQADAASGAFNHVATMSVGGNLPGVPTAPTLGTVSEDAWR